MRSSRPAPDTPPEELPKGRFRGLWDWAARHHRIGIWSCAVVAAWALLVLGRLDSGMARIHEVGGPAYGIGALSGRLFEPTPGNVSDIVRTWEQVAAPLRPEVIAWRRWYALVNVVLVLAYLGLLCQLMPRPLDGRQSWYKSWPIVLLLLATLEGVEIWWDYAPTVAGGRGLWVVNHVRLVLAVLLTLYALIEMVRKQKDGKGRERIARARSVAGRLRVQLAAVVAYTVLLLSPLSDQAPDMLRRMVEQWPQLVTGLTAVVLFSIVVYSSDPSSTPDERRHWATPWLMALFAVVFAALGSLPALHRLWAPAAIFGCIYVAGALARAWWSYREVRAPLRTNPGTLAGAEDLSRARYALAATPLIVTMLAVAASAADPAFFGTHTIAHRVALASSPLLAVLALRAPHVLEPVFGRSRKWPRHGISVLLIVAGGLLACPVTGPPIARFCGGLGVLLISLSILVLVLTLAQKGANRLMPPPGLQVLGFSRIPVLTLLAAWLLLASVIDTTGPSRVPVREARDAHARTDVNDAFHAWAASCAIGGDPSPLVLVGASGGGIRAAYWTAAILERLAPPSPSATCGPAQRLFALSGTSGGALGLVGYSTRFDGDQGAPASASLPWSQFREDNLAPTLAAMFLDDLPTSLAADLDYDRAQALEDSLMRANPGLKKDFSWHPDLTGGGPLLILNGTTTQGCRLTISPLRLGNGNAAGCGAEETAPSGQETVSPGDVDSDELLCGRNVSRATAALLSARFAYVSPSGMIPPCPGHNTQVRIVDGGYADNSGAQSLVDLYTHDLSKLIRDHNVKNGTCIVPIYVQISNGYQARTPAAIGRRTGELLTPLSAASAVRNHNSDVAMQRAKAVIENDDVGCAAGKQVPRYFEFAPSEHPGVQAPLGWTLSHAAHADLDDQLEAITSDSAKWTSHDHTAWLRLKRCLAVESRCV